jgi:polar amino acid transport system ATP-binding protein
MAPSAAWNPDLPLIRMRDVVKKFGATTILDGVSLDVMKGQVICIIGPSGAGKSTLIRCINALVPIDKGSILVEGQESMTPSSTSWRCAARSAWCSSSTICSRTGPRLPTS